jgi:ATP phosphoribosyltransferase regulatory subunit
MNEATTGAATLSDARANALIARYEDAGYERAEPAILQPAEPFLDLSGEDIRRRMYLTTDALGRELCLRPDLTIPVSRAYLASSAAGAAKGFCCVGPVFRYRGQDPGEFVQADIESFGRHDTAAADAEMISLGLEATSYYGLAAPEIRMGDIALFTALIEALDLPAAWKRRLVKDFNRADTLAHDLSRLAVSTGTSGPDYQGVLAALVGSDPGAAHALITDLLSIAGITTVGGRTVDEIADRFLEQAALGASARLPQEMRALIERFLAVAGDPDEAAAQIRALGTGASLGLDRVLDLFETRTAFLAARGVDVGAIRFSTAFGRGIDYYTGIVFELHDRAARAGGQLVAGGRYDKLLSRLGAPTPIPAVGFAVWIDRLAALRANA